MSRMFIELKVGEVLIIGTTQVRLEKKSGQVARLAIVADESTVIDTPKPRRDATNKARMSALHIEPGAHHV